MSNYEKSLLEDFSDEDLYEVDPLTLSCKDVITDLLETDTSFTVSVKREGSKRITVYHDNLKIFLFLTDGEARFDCDIPISKTDPEFTQSICDSICSNGFDLGLSRVSINKSQSEIMSLHCNYTLSTCDCGESFGGTVAWNLLQFTEDINRLMLSLRRLYKSK